MEAIIKAVEQIIEPVYVVGGPVRDLLLGREPTDYDFATPLKPDEIEARVRAAGKRAYIAGRRFGTIGFKVDGHLVEVTTFRTENYQAGNRKPQVAFVDTITNDLSRRDFTINAMALREGRVIDPFGGREDVVHGIIRTVGKPQDRFKEDPLRMLRAARFAAQLQFKVDLLTEHMATNHAHHILDVSRERWVQELDKLLLTDKPSIGLSFLARTRLLHYMLPDLAIQVGYDQDSPYHHLTLWEHTLQTVDRSPHGINLRWAALMHDVGKPYVRTKNDKGYSNYIHHELVGAELTKAIGQYLAWPKERIAKVATIVREHMHDGSPIEEADNASKG